MEKLKEVVPYKEKKDASKKEQVREMFDRIAPTYDILNHIFSMGIDRRWRRKVIKYLRHYHPHTILDIATGTGDMIFYLTSLKPEKIVGTDISSNMLEIGRKKIDNKLPEYKDKIFFEVCDAENLYCLEDNSFDAITSVFGIRNSENPDKWINESFRVLKNKGILAILEFSHIRNPVIKYCFNLYFNKILPFIGKIITGDRAYYYLPESVKNFPSGKEFANFVESFGFKTLKIKPLTFGIATIYLFEKNI